MDLTTLTTLISTLGFPIAACLALGYFIFKTNKETREDFKSREGILLDANKQFAVALTKAADAIENAVDSQSVICDRLGGVESKVDELVTLMQGSTIFVGTIQINPQGMLMDFLM